MRWKALLAHGGARWAIAALLVSAVASTAAVVAPAGAQALAASLYSSTQAARGGEVYATNCAVCHGPELTGGGGAPALRGPDFLFGWSPKTTKDLVNFISTNMPPGQGHTLPDAQYVDAAAFILSTNGFKAGSADLTLSSPRPIAAP